VVCDKYDKMRQGTNIICVMSIYHWKNMVAVRMCQDLTNAFVFVGMYYQCKISGAILAS